MQSNWKKKKYRDVVSNIPLTKKKVKKRDYLESGKYPVIDQGQELIGGFSNDNTKVIANPNGAIIFGDHTKVIKYYTNDFIPGADGVKVLFPREDFLSKALYYFTKAIQLPGKGYARHYQYLEKSDINVPPLEKQEEIAQKLDSLFSKIDAGEEDLQQVQQQLEAYKQSILIKLFNKKRTAKLSNLIKGIRYGTSKKSEYGLGKVPVMRIPNINVKERSLDDTDLKTSNLSEKELIELKLKEGDILIIRSNGSIDLVGRSAVVTEKYVGYAFAGYLIRLEADNSKILPEYLSLAMSTPFVRNQIQRRGKSTSGVNNINSKELQDLDIPSATLSEQSQILEEAKKIESIIKHVMRSIAEGRNKFQYLRQSILKKAFNGELI